MLERDHSFVVSTDSSGLLGTPSAWKQVWSSAFEKPNFKGFEMIGWGGIFRAWTEYLIREAEKNGCSIVGIHGRIGNENTHKPFKNLKALIGNQLLIETTDLISTYGNKLEYILLHSPELETRNVYEYVAENAQSIKQLYIENHLSIGSLGKAIEIAEQLRHRGVNAGIMFDLFHYFNSHDQDLHLSTRWRELTSQVNRLLKTSHDQESVPVGLHIPVGTNRIDSFPKEIGSEMWKDLGTILADYPDILLVFENRQKGLSQLSLTQNDIQNQQRRNMDIIDNFTENQFI